MAKYEGFEIPMNVPKRLDFKNDDGKIRSLEIGFEIHNNGKTITSTEIGKLKLKEDVFGKFNDDFDEILETLTERIKKKLSTTYMNTDGILPLAKPLAILSTIPRVMTTTSSLTASLIHGKS